MEDAAIYNSIILCTGTQTPCPEGITAAIPRPQSGKESPGIPTVLCNLTEIAELTQNLLKAASCPHIFSPYVRCYIVMGKDFCTVLTSVALAEAGAASGHLRLISAIVPSLCFSLDKIK